MVGSFLSNTGDRDDLLYRLHMNSGAMAHAIMDLIL
jgi:hypothetical protein